MKKIFAILALVSGAAFAGDSATVETQNIKTINGADQELLSLSVKHEFNQTFAGDVAFNNAVTDGTNALGTRLEAGLTAGVPVTSTIKGYVRTGFGQRYSNTANYSYYSVEPGVIFPAGPFTAKVGYRFRDAVDNNAHPTDQTKTIRAGVSYPLTKVDTVGVRYDKIRGDSNQNVVALNYTHSF